MNSTLQCLFSIPPVRQALLSYTASTDSHNELRNDPVMTELQRVFGQLQCSPKKFFDPTSLVKSLELAPEVQQDAQECDVNRYLECFGLFLTNVCNRFLQLLLDLVD